MYSLLKKYRLHISVFLGFLIFGVSPFSYVYAGELDFLEKSLTDEEDSFKKIRESVETTGASGYKFLRTLGIVILVIAVMLVGFGIALGSAKSREEGKAKAINILIAAGCIFGAIGIVVMLMGFGSSFNSSRKDTDPPKVTQEVTPEATKKSNKNGTNKG